ncbi:BcsE family c-di-GMP-binding protein [Pseudomonas putida]|uniref:Peptidase n=1 Tax=Pseudomonas putida TaxID=303 RepID=A0A1L5PS34_PSEPU|nr:BcsE family c-di-GMP-binding protein [Pseudomonas putida]APO82987.1 peptidase [Pseudomonas putida]
MPWLAISGLGAESSQLHVQGLYWLACDNAEDATVLCRQVVGGLPEHVRAALVADAQAIGDVLSALDTAQGPAELALYEADLQAARHLVDDLPRIDAVGRVLVLLAPADVWGAGNVESWCNALRPVLLAEATLLLVISSGQSAGLVERLRAFNQGVDGLAQVYRGKGGVRYLQHFWSNPLGKTGTRDVELARLEAGFAAAGAPQAPSDTGGDELLYLAQRPVLEGAPAFSEHWQVCESLEELGAKAGRAVSATVIFAMDGGQRLDSLARQLHRLRQLRGSALKLVVREMAPTLRYQDEQLLLACGASQIVPFGASLSRFLTMVESIQGYLWRRRLPSDFDALLARLRPLAICGLVAPRAFAEAVQTMWHGVRNGEIAHQLLVLRPAPGLTPLQACSRTVFRRDGDIACVVGDVLFLFLFACRSEGVEQALDHIFQLSWKELFISQEVLAGVDSLATPAFLDDSVPQPPRLDAAAQLPTQARPALAPRRVALGKRGTA